MADVLVIGSVAVPALVNLVGVLRREWRKGVVIDGFGRQLTIRQDSALPRGVVVVRSRSGEVTVRDGAELKGVIAGALPSGGGPPEGVAAGGTDHG